MHIKKVVDRERATIVVWAQGPRFWPIQQQKLLQAYSTRHMDVNFVKQGTVRYFGKLFKLSIEFFSFQNIADSCDSF